MLAGVMVISVALAMLGLALFMKHRAGAQSTWDQLPATIVASRIEYTNAAFPNIEYEYVHEGRRFRGIQLRTLEVVRLDWAKSARRMIEKYPVGSAITVFVDPDNPSNSVIEPGGDPGFLHLWYAVTGFAALGGVRLIYLATG